MSTGKIDQRTVLTQLGKTLQTTQPAAVAPAVKVEEVAPKGPENIYGERSKHLDTKSGEGKAVSTTATVGKLWGQAAMESSKPPLSVLTLKNLTPEQAKTKLAELEKKKSSLETRMQGRVEELDHKWRYMRLTKRTEALKQYLTESPNLAAGERAQLQTAIASSEAAQCKIDDLQSEVKDLKPQPGTKKCGTPEERKELARKIMAARREHSDAVKNGTATVDDAGLKVERLALTENLIDPSGGANSQYGSMMGLLGQYFEVTFMISTVNNIYFGPVGAMLKEMHREQADDAKRKAIEDHWRQRDDLMRRMVKEIPLKAELAKRPVEAVKGRDLGKVSAADGAKIHGANKAE